MNSIPNERQVEASIEFFEGVIDAAKNKNQSGENAIWNAFIALRKHTEPHHHISGHTVGWPADKCALCGADIRWPVHMRDNQ